MNDSLDEVVGLSKVVDHKRRVALVHGKCGDDVPDDLLLRQQNCYTGKATKSRRHKSTTQLIQRSNE